MIKVQNIVSRKKLNDNLKLAGASVERKEKVND
jgi:hypothetical protein